MRYASLFAGLTCVLVISTAVFVGACDVSESDSNLPDTLVPLEPGNRWVVAAQDDTFRAEVTQDGSLEVVRERAGVRRHAPGGRATVEWASDPPRR